MGKDRMTSKEEVEFESEGAEVGVSVAGSWDGWKQHPLTRVGERWVGKLVLARGRHEYKYVVDGEWVHNPGRAWARDKQGNVNNVIVVGETEEDRQRKVEQLVRTMSRIKRLVKEIKDLKQWLGTAWHSEVSSLSLDPKAGV